MVITFGKYEGRELSTVPDTYCKWLAKPVYPREAYKSTYSTERHWSVPAELTVEARKEMDKRGYDLKGRRWVSRYE